MSGEKGPVIPTTEPESRAKEILLKVQNAKIAVSGGFNNPKKNEVKDDGKSTR